MKSIVIGSILVFAVIAFSGCTYKSPCHAAKPACQQTVLAPSPCGCK